MAVMDQDNFSNISWHSEQEAGAAASNTAASSHDASSPEYPGSGARAGGRTVEGEDANLEPAHGDEILECVVSSPNKENDGSKDAYVSYLITTHVCSSLYSLHGEGANHVPLSFLSHSQLFPHSSERRRLCADASLILSFSIRCSAASTKAVLSHHCRISRGWSMFVATGSVRTSRIVVATHYSDSCRV